MRIDRLDLTAYGPFTDAHLDLSAPGLHVVLGPNEAGKSSTLAAVTDALFGIPVRTTAGFVHHMTRLEVGMTLRGAHGEVLRFRRLKKAKESLRGPDDEVLDPAVLAAFTGGVDRATFTTMFGITHEQLIAGGRDLLAGHGELGQLLFGASSGSAHLHRTLKQLEERSAALFKAGGHNPRINAGISRHRTAAAAARDRALRPRAHDDVVDRIRRLEAARAASRAELATQSADRDRLQLLLAVLPNLRARRALARTVDQLAPATRRLRPEIGAELDAIGTTIEAARAQLRTARLEAERLRDDMEVVAADDLALGAADAIRALGERRAQYEQAVVDRPAVAAEEADARARAETAARRWRPALALADVRRSLELPADLLAAVVDLADEHAGLEASAAAVASRVAQAGEARHAARAALDAAPAPPDGRVLDTALSACHEDGDLLQRRRAVQASLQHVEREAATDIGLLGLVPGAEAAAEVVAAYPVPALATVRHHDQVLGDLDRAAAEHERALVEARRALDDDERALARLVRAEVPTTAQLRTLRQARDEVWAELRARLDAAADEPVPDRGATDELVARLDALVAAADDHADRLRTSAAHAEARADLEESVVVRRRAIPRVEAAVAEHERTRTAARSAWRALWRDVPTEPAPPAAMYAWLAAHARVVNHARRLAELRDERATIDAAIEVHRRDLRAALRQVQVRVPDEATLPTLVDVATATKVELAQRAEQHARLVADQARLTRAHETAAREERDAAARASAWRERWRAALARVELDPGLDPVEAVALVRAIASVRDQIDTATRAATRLEVLDAFIAGFEADVARVVALVAPELGTVDPAAAVRRLGARLEAALAAAARAEALRRELDQRERDAADGERREAAARAHLTQLLDEADVRTERELRDAIARAERLHAAETELARVDRELQLQSGGQSAEALEAARAGRDEAALLEQGVALDAELADRRAALEAEGIELGQLQEQRAAMDGSAGAADAAADAQMALAQIAVDTEEYLAVHLASLLLRDAIARYREQHQAPLLARARPWFARLTDGSFETLETEIDAKGTTVLEAVRPDGERVLVSALSEGTRDQLFLALRLAAVTLAAERAEPMPLLLDDLFVNFDEARTRAALEIFGELAGAMQVVLFTHHRHVADLAAAALAPTQLHVHHLAPRHAPLRPASAVRLRPVS